eukprot:5485539-Heterocapsa_arctica.AAC.1
MTLLALRCSLSPSPLPRSSRASESVPLRACLLPACDPGRVMARCPKRLPPPPAAASTAC